MFTRLDALANARHDPPGRQSSRPGVTLARRGPRDVRTNHYERAFEAYLRAHRVPYVAVDEKRRSLDTHGSLKNVDFIVSPSDATPLPLDVKGRRFPSGTASPQYWRNWSTWDDLRGLAAWQEKLGPSSCALLVFAYHVVGDRSPVEAGQLHRFEERRYAFLGVRVADYIRFARPLSRRWQTVRMPTPVFRQAARPFSELLGLLAAARAAGGRPEAVCGGPGPGGLE